MNWVGGSRNRVMLKSDARKQREFFEKKKMQEKIKNLGLTAGTQRPVTGSMDLVTLFIVNQIAAKKDTKNNHKVTHLSQEKGALGSTNEDPLELPMSPCSPSRLSLVESQPQYSVQTLGFRKRKHYLSDLHNNRQLSPVLESNFSDCSASDYRHVLSDTHSPFSSATPGSSSGRFLVGQRGEFKPFSQPREVRQGDPWLTVSHGSQLKVQNPPVSRDNFDSKESSHPDKEEKHETALMGFVNEEYRSKGKH
ncbi:hypothetical protein AAFF_G00281070 [Aldrovandia affinis]|uniref:Uncharacterized protein n=1 Tax=Aldrovandia affinis TaxID=143900 RepID=A0AAD7RAK5_9TELE|nr:hypothetical protein AAFF_G00281070 [Aldrovandia affinis]